MLSTQFWKKYFTVYDYLNGVIPYNELLKTIVSELSIMKGDSVLDVGSGTGNLSIELEKQGADVTAIDYSKEGISIHLVKQPHLKIINSDLTCTLPFSDNSFDKIVSNNVIYTLPTSKRGLVFGELFRVLKPGGAIVISNIASGFKPSHVYFDHVRKLIQKKGYISSVIELGKLLVPTIQIFYYNYRIKKEDVSGSYSFMCQDEQVKLLRNSGFKDVSDTKRVYSKQAILNKASK